MFAARQGFFSNITTPITTNSFIARIDNSVGGYSAGAIDSSGNIYVAGSYRDIAGTGVRHGFILKYNGSGVLQLQRSITDFNTTTSSDASVNGIAVDGSNNIYVTGSYINPSGGTNCFTAKYNPSLC